MWAAPANHPLPLTQNYAQTDQSPPVETHNRVDRPDTICQPSIWLDQSRLVSEHIQPMSDQTQTRVPHKLGRTRSNTQSSITWLGPSLASSRGTRVRGSAHPPLSSVFTRTLWCTAVWGGSRTPHDGLSAPPHVSGAGWPTLSAPPNVGALQRERGTPCRGVWVRRTPPPPLGPSRSRTLSSIRTPPPGGKLSLGATTSAASTALHRRAEAAAPSSPP